MYFGVFQLDSVLTKSDHMLSLVKDLFGDDARVNIGIAWKCIDRINVSFISQMKVTLHRYKPRCII